MPITRDMKDINVIDVTGSSNDPLSILLEEDEQEEQEPYTSQDELNEIKANPFTVEEVETHKQSKLVNGHWQNEQSESRHQITSSGLTRKQLAGLEALLNQSFGETMQSIADRANVSRPALYRWLRDPVFKALYDEQLKARLVNAKAPQWLTALNKASIRVGEPGQVQAAKILAEIHGLLKSSGSSVNVDINNVNTVNGNETIPLHLLPTWLKVVIINVVQGSTISNELETRIINELSDGLTLNDSGISPEYRLDEEDEHEPIRLISASDYDNSNDNNNKNNNNISNNNNNGSMLF